MKKILLLCILSVFASSAYSQFDKTKTTDQLSTVLNSSTDNQKIRVVILLKDRVDVEELRLQLDQQPISNEEKSGIILDALKEKASMTQNYLISQMDFFSLNGAVESYESYWIINAVSAVADARVIKYLTYRNDVELIEVDNEIIFEEEISSTPSEVKQASVETGLKVIKADVLWKLGYTGQGRLVMNIDSGVDGNHRALRYKWKGNSTPWYHAWMDANGGNFPNYCSSHGTHTMGTMCGRDTVSADTVGVCPNAQWMAAKRNCSGNYSTFALTVFQWSMDPDSNSATPDFPDVINCSWTTTDPGGSECNGLYKTMLLTLENFGIAVVWSAGNSGSGSSTITSPKNINTNEVNLFCTGALDGNNTGYPIANFSSRGPSTCGGSGSLQIKPEVSAPGVNVRSSNPGNQYGLSSGTSMASPHAAGSVALLKSFAPRLTSIHMLKAIYYGATDLGTAGEDNIYGKGLVNLVQAMIHLGPSISHTPLLNTPNVSGPYRVSAYITPSSITNNIVDTSQIKLFWGRGTISDSLFMQRDTGNTFYADIPGNGSPSVYKYYISAMDTFDVKGHSPGDAPLTSHSFNAGVTEIIVHENVIPEKFALHQNYPNPFNPVTSIRFDIPKATHVQLTVFDAAGREVAVLVNAQLNSGKYETTFGGTAVSSGIYFYVLEAGENRFFRKMILLK